MTDKPEEPTARLLADAGVGAGMRVLDIGCGRGDVAFLAAQLVGPGGQVVGVDREPAPLEAGRALARQRGLDNVGFVCADIGALPRDLDPFDVVVGRRVLMYQPDPVASLMHLTQALVPGGLLVLQEHDSTAMPVCRPAMPLHERVSGWIWQTVDKEGADTRMGFRLAALLGVAGQEIEHVRAEAIVLTADQSHPIGAILRAMQPRIVAAGVATVDELAVETIDAQLAAERRKTDGTCLWELVFGAWARKPA